MSRRQRLGAAWLLAAVLAACASPPAKPVDTPQLRLAPASLGAPLALQQQLTVSAGGRMQRLEVALEADPQAVRLALLEMGQVLARLEWDGSTLRQERVPGLPDAASGERILSALQLVYWPLAAIADALPAGWSVSAQPGERTLSQGSQAVLRVRYPEPQRAELEHLSAGYRILIESRPWSAAP